MNFNLCRHVKFLTFILHVMIHKQDALYSIKQQPYTLNLPNYPMHFAVESNRLVRPIRNPHSFYAHIRHVQFWEQRWGESRV